MLQGKRGLLILQIILIGIFTFAYVDAKNDNTTQNLRLFGEVLRNVEEKYVEEVDMVRLLEAATEGLLRPLDPYCQLLIADDHGNFPDGNHGIFEVNGLILGASGQSIRVLSSYINNEFEQRGIRSGDYLYKIGDTPVRGLTLKEAVNLISQTKGDTLHLTIVPFGSRSSIEYNFMMNGVSGSTIPYAFVTPDQIGYIRVNYLTNQTANQIADHLNQFQNQGVQKLILDLRDCSNGEIEDAVAVADLFIPNGKTISKLNHNRTNDAKTYRSESAAIWTDPIIVFTNYGTAGMAEIIAADINELELGISIGTASNGKTGYLEVLPVTSNIKIELTTAEYLTAHGNSLLREVTEDEAGDEKEIRPAGLVPTIEVEENVEKHLIRRLRAEKLITQFVANQPLLQGDAINDEVQEAFQSFLKEHEFDVEPELIQELWDRVSFYIERASLQKHQGNQAAFQFVLLDDPLYQEAISLYETANTTSQLIEQGRIRQAEATNENDEK